MSDFIKREPIKGKKDTFHINESLVGYDEESMPSYMKR